MSLSRHKKRKKAKRSKRTMRFYGVKPTTDELRRMSQSASPAYPMAYPASPAYPISASPAYPISASPAYPISASPAYPISASPAPPVSPIVSQSVYSASPTYPMAYPASPAYPISYPASEHAPPVSYIDSQSVYSASTARSMSDSASEHAPPVSPVLKHEHAKRILTDFTTRMINTERCIKRRAEASVETETLEDIMCDFIVAYVPKPLTRHERYINGLLVNYRTEIGRGKNGVIVDSGAFESNPLVTKYTIRQTSDYIFELVANMVVVNTILLTGKAVHHLVPSYGIFQCSKIMKVHTAEICKSSGEDYFLVQQRIEGVTLRHFIRTKEAELPDESDPDFTRQSESLLSQIKSILVQVIRTIMVLEQSEFILNHNDLHMENVIIEDGTNRAYIIDYGQASYTIDGMYISQSNGGKKYAPTNIGSLGSSYDMNIFIRDLLNYSNTFKTYLLEQPANQRILNFISEFMSIIDTSYAHETLGIPIAIFDIPLDIPIGGHGIPEIYPAVTRANPYWFYDVLIEYERVYGSPAVHDENIQTLKKCTVKYIVEKYFPDDLKTLIM